MKKSIQGCREVGFHLETEPLHIAWAELHNNLKKLVKFKTIYKQILILTQVSITFILKIFLTISSVIIDQLPLTIIKLQPLDLDFYQNIYGVFYYININQLWRLQRRKRNCNY
jgi:hypothetical protein